MGNTMAVRAATLRGMKVALLLGNGMLLEAGTFPAPEAKQARELGPWREVAIGIVEAGDEVDAGGCEGDEYPADRAKDTGRKVPGHRMPPRGPRITGFTLTQEWRVFRIVMVVRKCFVVRGLRRSCQLGEGLHLGCLRRSFVLGRL